MFGIGWSEFIFLAILALLILGPDKLPEVARQLGKWTRELRKIAGELQGEFAREFNKDEFPNFNNPVIGPIGESGKPDLTRAEDNFGAVVRKKPAETQTDAAKSS